MKILPLFKVSKRNEDSSPQDTTGNAIMNRAMKMSEHFQYRKFKMQFKEIMTVIKSM